MQEDPGKDPAEHASVVPVIPGNLHKAGHAYINQILIKFLSSQKTYIKEKFAKNHYPKKYVLNKHILGWTLATKLRKEMVCN